MDEEDGMKIAREKVGEFEEKRDRDEQDDAQKTEDDVKKPFDVRVEHGACEILTPPPPCLLALMIDISFDMLLSPCLPDYFRRTPCDAFRGVFLRVRFCVFVALWVCLWYIVWAYRAQKSHKSSTFAWYWVSLYRRWGGMSREIAKMGILAVY